MDVELAGSRFYLTLSTSQFLSLCHFATFLIILVNRNKWKLEYDSVSVPFHVPVGRNARVRKKPMMTTTASNNKIWKLYKSTDWICH